MDNVRLFSLQHLAEAGDLLTAHQAHPAWVLRLFLVADDAYLAIGMEHWLAPLEGGADNLVAATQIHPTVCSRTWSCSPRPAPISVCGSVRGRVLKRWR